MIKRIFQYKCLLWLLILTSAFIPGDLAEAENNDFPRPRGAINDFASVIPSDIESTMNNLSQELWSKAETAVVVATFKSIGDNEPDTYANKLYEAWGIGKKGEDKGALIFLVMDQRRVRIETGYGVEGILPDGRVGSILDQYVVPLLKQGQYGKGLLNGMIAVGEVIAKDAGVTLGDGYRAHPPARERKPSKGSSAYYFFFLIFILIFGLLPSWLRMGGRNRRTYRRGYGTYYGGGFGGSGFSGGFGGFGGGFSGGGGAGRGF